MALQNTNRWPTWATMGASPDMIPPGGSAAAPSTGGDWGQIAQAAIPAGIGILGGVLNARAHNQPEQWRQKIIESEIGRRNTLQGAAAPTLMGMLGYRTPGPGQALQAQLGGAPGASGPTGGYSAGGPQRSVLGAVGSGVGAAAGSFLGGPIGGQIGAGIGSLAGKIGAGRRTANSFVQGGENAFGNDLAQISAMAKTDPAGAKALFQQKYGNYQALLNQEMSAGGTRAKVAQQSSTNPALQQTIRALAQELGVAL